MRIQKNMIDNKKVIQIYLTDDEKKGQDIKDKIEKLKVENNVVLFVSVEEKVEEVFRNIIKIMKKQENN